MIKVLIGEDDEYSAEIYRISLKAKGHDVIITNDGEKCVKVFKHEFEQLGEKGQEKAFDVVILDYAMPVINGVEAAKEILTINPNQRIIFATAHLKELLAESAVRLGEGTEVLEKPFLPNTLVELFETPLKKGMNMPNQ